MAVLKSQKTCCTFFDDKFMSIAYDVYQSNDTETAVILAHGFFSNSGIFGDFPEELAQVCNVVVPEMIGRGKSDYANSKKYYRFEQYVSDYVAVINACGFKNLIWVGTSIGALIGIRLAAMKKTAVRAIVVDNCAISIPLQESANIRYNSVNFEFSSMDELLKSIRSTIGREVSEKECLEFVIDNFDLYDNKIMPNYDKELINSINNISGHVDLSTKWSALTCPILLLRAADSKNFTDSDFKQMRSKKNIEAYEYRGDDDLLKYSDETKGVILRWIKKILKEYGTENLLGINYGD